MRKLPPLTALRAFEAAARNLSFKRAAEELGVTPTAISHHIRQLEQACGQRLFKRRPRPLALTGAGARLFPVLRDGLDAFSVAIASLAEGTGSGPLRVTTPNAFASRWLVPRLPLWREAHAGIALRVIGTDAVVDLRSGEADLAVRYARTMPSGLAGREIFRDSFFPVCSPRLLTDGSPVARAADLLRYPLIHFDWQKADAETPDWDRWWNAARSIDPDLPEITTAGVLSFREELHAIDAVVAGQGIAICSDVVISRELKNGVLVKAHELSLQGYAYYLAHLPDHPRLPLIRAFAAWMKSVE